MIAWRSVSRKICWEVGAAVVVSLSVSLDSGRVGAWEILAGAG